MHRKVSFIALCVALCAGTSHGAEVPSATNGSVPGISTTSATTPLELQSPIVEKRYFRAAGEAIIIGWSPWIWSHFVKDYPYADISMDSVKHNFQNPPWWDADGFHTNMWGHPYQGSLYYNAARENGFNFWESAPFVVLGDFGWEYIMETEPPAYNDFSNTFFGGMERGEMTYRLSRIIRDNRAHGWEKFWRELGAGVVNPVGFLDRAVFGDMWKESANPADRFPSSLFMMVDGGYQKGRENSAHPDQGIVNVVMRYNDPHETRIRKPFDYFDVNGTISTAKGPLIPWIDYRGLLAGWDLKDEADVHHMLSPGLTFTYFNNGPSSFGGSGLDLTVLSRWKLSHDFSLRTEVGGQAFIAAGIQTDYQANNVASTGRNYDFGSGGGPKFDLRVRRDQVDWLRCTLAAGWFPTHNGLSTESRILIANAEARYPLTRDLFAGLGWSFQERFTQYDTLPSVTRTNSGMRVFMSWAFRILG